MQAKDGAVKRCSKCKNDRPLSRFALDRSRRDGLHSQCKDCQSAHAKQKRATDPEHVAKCRARSKQYRASNPDAYRNSVRDATLRAKYGVGQADYEAMLKAQGGGCAICGRTNPGVSWGRNLHIDHDHSSGRIRGLLCQPCNTSIGKFNDDPALLRKAAAYIEHGGVPSTS